MAYTGLDLLGFESIYLYDPSATLLFSEPNLIALSFPCQLQFVIVTIIRTRDLLVHSECKLRIVERRVRLSSER